MYDSFFQLKQRPFELIPNPRFLYPSSSYRKAVIYLDYGLKERAGFMVLTGEVGSGKTTLIRHFIKGLDGTTSLSKVFNTKVNAEQLIAMIADDFGLDPAGKDKVQILKELNEFLIGEYRQKRRALLIIDEAQNLAPELLEEVRLLSNLETDDSKLLQILLVGQPELAKMLSLTELRQLRQRISIICQLYPLNRKETEEYILHRLEIAGNRTALQFAPEALDAIYAYSTGIPRLINIVCGFILLTAFTEETRIVNGEMANDIIGSLEPQAPLQQSPALSGGRQALLNALCVELRDQSGSSGTGTDAAGGERNDGMLLREMSLRVAAMEKEYDRVVRPDIDEVRTRTANLEKAHASLRKQFEATFTRMQNLAEGRKDALSLGAIRTDHAGAQKDPNLGRGIPRGKRMPAGREEENRQ